jgi:hypothetical protein
MPWFSDLSSANEFRAAAFRDSDLVAVHAGNIRSSRALSSILDDRPDVWIYGPDYGWKAFVRRKGRKLEVSVSARIGRHQSDPRQGSHLPRS